MNERYKILLVNPPGYRLYGRVFTGYPIGLCYLAGVLERNGFEVSVYNADYNYEKLGRDAFAGALKATNKYDEYLHILEDISHPLWQEIERVISQQAPNLVGISIMTPKYGSALNVAKLVKRFDPNIPVVVGGVHPTVLPDDTLRNKDIDVVVRGEGEYTFLDLIRAMRSQESLDEVAGISYKRQNSITHNPNRPLIKNLDELPFPARHLLLQRETYPSRAFGALFATRGCPHHCIFCCSHEVWTRQVRYRSPENVVDEIKYVHKTFGTRTFRFEDDSFALNKRYVIKLCELLIKEKLGITWACETRADTITADVAKIMKAAGCQSVDIGVESGDDETLKRIKKGITVEQVKCAHKALKESGIYVATLFVIGFPWENEEKIKRTVSLMEELDSFYANYAIATPYPGTELHDICVSEGLIPRDINWSTFFQQSPDMFLTKILTREQVSRVLRETEQTFDRHNKRKRIERILLHPLSTVKLVYQMEYYKPRFLRALFRSLLP